MNHLFRKGRGKMKNKSRNKSKNKSKRNRKYRTRKRGGTREEDEVFLNAEVGDDELNEEVGDDLLQLEVQSSPAAAEAVALPPAAPDAAEAAEAAARPDTPPPGRRDRFTEGVATFRKNSKIDDDKLYEAFENDDANDMLDKLADKVYIMPDEKTNALLRRRWDDSARIGALKKGREAYADEGSIRGLPRPRDDKEGLAQEKAGQTEGAAVLPPAPPEGGYGYSRTKKYKRKRTRKRL